jgi:predicted GNAT family N-acyltransferase
LRKIVFVNEQSVPADLEQDGLDATCAHFVAWEGDRLAGTARMREVHGAAKAERVAVAREARRSGVGRRLMEALEAEAQARGAREVRLNAQLSAVPFYAALGYVAEGVVFEEAGIGHLAMRKGLPARAGTARLPRVPRGSGR